MLFCGQESGGLQNNVAGWTLYAEVPRFPGLAPDFPGTQCNLGIFPSSLFQETINLFAQEAPRHLPLQTV